MADTSIEALAMIARSAREQHLRSVEALDAAKAEEKRCLDAVEIAEDDFQLACDALLRGPAKGQADG